MARSVYSSSFYATYAEESQGSAREVLAIVNRMLRPQSVVDVGCGIGTWLSVWAELGVTDLLGIDGEYVRAADLMIPRDKFRAMNLEKVHPPYERQFELVESLEVAEHLSQEKAEEFVAFLCWLGPVVLFSAAIPYQDGEHHVNEQWPEYWAELFSRQGYAVVDAIRPLIWENPRVAYYYAQNALVFVRSDRDDLLKKVRAGNNEATALARVHPRKWHEKNEEKPIPRLEKLVGELPMATMEFGRRAARKLGKLMRERR
jgi:SAM-dependent methyltransferase